MRSAACGSAVPVVNNTFAPTDIVVTAEQEVSENRPRSLPAANNSARRVGGVVDVFVMKSDGAQEHFPSPFFNLPVTCEVSYVGVGAPNHAGDRQSDDAACSVEGDGSKVAGGGEDHK